MDRANEAHPGVWWWVKGDRTDDIAGLGESVKHVWSGDVDLADGKLQVLYDEYLQRQSFIEGLGLGGRQGQWDISNNLTMFKSQPTSDIYILASGIYTTQLLSHDLIIIANLIEFATANSEYSVKLASGKGTDNVLRTLAWNIEDLSRLNEDG